MKTKATILSVSQSASLCDCSTDLIYAAIASGELTNVMPRGLQIALDREQVKRWLAAKRGPIKRGRPVGWRKK